MSLPVIVIHQALCAVVWSAITVQSPSPAPAAAQQRFEEALEQGRYELARKIAIVNFQPVWHCRVSIEQAAAQLAAAQRLVAEQKMLTDTQLEQAGHMLSEARDHLDQARTLSLDYARSGWQAAVGEQVRSLLDAKRAELEALQSRLDTAGTQARPLDALFSLPAITERHVAPQPPAEKLVLGLYLAGRGDFDGASAHCFEPLQTTGSGTTKKLARYAAKVLGAWQQPQSADWKELVEIGLDTVELLPARVAEDARLAGWLLCLVARVARDRGEVPQATVAETLAVLEELRLPEPQAVHEKLLAARMEHERFLLSRRSGDWNVGAPHDRRLELYRRTSDWWIGAEAALIAAAGPASGTPAATAVAECASFIDLMRAVNPAAAEHMAGRLQRFQARDTSFEKWLSLARSSRDHRGTLLPDVLHETPQQFADIVRRGVEPLIAGHLARGDIDAAFQEVQNAKALSVGRDLRSGAGASAGPIPQSRLLSTKLMSLGEGGAQLISRQELFVEYFVGPQRAWAFYLFAPGDPFEPMQVVELNRAALWSAVRQSLEALRQGRVPPDPGDWLLGGSPRLRDLWEGLDERIKKPNPQLRRVVLAPDGPLCCLPLTESQFSFASSVTCVPTAAVLHRADHLEAPDVQALWNTQRGDLLDGAVVARRSGGNLRLQLWPGAAVTVLLSDVTE